MNSRTYPILTEEILSFFRPSEYEDYICPISREILVHPVRLNCSHLISNLYLHGNLCPLCRKTITHIHSAYETEEKIRNIWQRHQAEIGFSYEEYILFQEEQIEEDFLNQMHYSATHR